jgi:hypothetical protein
VARSGTYRVTLAAIVFAAGAVVAFVAGAGADAADPYYDTTPPTITCSTSPADLWPPNHKLVPVTATVTVTDPSVPTSFTLMSVTSSEPDSGLGKDDVPGDIVGWNVGTSDTSGSLRAERFGTRTYTLVYRGHDSAGNSADCQTTVPVSKSK